MRSTADKHVKSTATHGNAARTVAWKIAASAGIISLMLSAVAGTALAAKPGGHGGGGGGHPGGGGGHPGGGGGGHSGGGAPHFSARAATPHFSAPHVAHFSRPAFHAHAAGVSHLNRVNNNSIRHAHMTPSHVTPSAVHPLATTAHSLATGVHPTARAAAFHADPRSFAAHRQLAGDPAFRPFWNRGWHPNHHLGWVGPLFWPYAYGDFFYYALWPDDYYDVDPFWAYGYGDIYSAIFSPYSYDDYVQGPSAPAKMATLTQSMAQSCSDEAAEVTGWPIDQIQAAVQPTQQQGALLDDLGNALVKASDEVKSHCPTAVSFTPTARLGAMQQRLQALADAVSIVGPPLDKFYGSLSDEQKARFNGIAPQAPKHAQTPQSQNAQNPQAQCNVSVMAWPTDQIDRVVRPNDAQRTKLVALQSAASQASDTIKTACPGEMPATPPERLAAVGKRLNALLQAVQTVRPALSDFYDSLSDDQKARFNGMGKQLFARNEE
jgi:hypothetical protein